MEDLHPSQIRVFNLVNCVTLIGYMVPVEQEMIDEEGEVFSSPTEFVTVYYPYEMTIDKIYDESSPGNQHFDISLARWIPCLMDEAVILNKSNIVATGRPNEEMVECYDRIMSEEMLIGIDEEGEDTQN